MASEKICNVTTEPISNCEFFEVKDSVRVSEYEQSIIHYQKECCRCGERVFASKPNTQKPTKREL